MVVLRSRGRVALFLSFLAAVGSGCGDDKSASTPNPATCSDAGCAGEEAGTGGDAEGAEAGTGGRPAADGGGGGAAATSGAGSSGSGSAGTTAGRGGSAGVRAEAGSSAGAGGSGAGAGAAGATGASGATAPPASCTTCEAYRASAELARVQSTELNAMSGLAIGRKNPQLIFAHNDRASSVVFVLDMTGKLRARLNLSNARTTDIEDIAIGPCPSGSCVYVADIGDNAAQRREYAVLRFPEPEVSDSTSASMSTVEVERMPFTYADGSHNAEGFMVDPGSGKMYVVTKVADGQPSRIYRVEEPAMANGPRTAVKVADLTVPKSTDRAISAAAAQPCGRGFALRAYNVIYEFRGASGETFEQSFAAMPVAITGPVEQQSEALDYLPDGSGLISSGEGAQVPIFATRCAP